LKAPEVAIYLRLSPSSERDGSSTENQRPEVAALCAARGWRISREYVETISGAAEKRPAFAAMKEDARRGKFGVLVIWSIDRFGRSMAGNLDAFTMLEKAGVRVVSVREPFTESPDGVRDLLLAIFSWVAQQERKRLVERTRAGLDRARKAGTRLGRRPASADAVLKAWGAVEGEGLTVPAAAARFGVSAATMYRRRPKTRLTGTCLGHLGPNVPDGTAVDPHERRPDCDRWEVLL
jgi:DNA invertase Pin-like site-specific DNA recombinase